MKAGENEKEDLKKIEILQECRRELWKEINYRRGAEDKTVLWITVVMFLVAGGILQYPIAYFGLKLFIALLVIGIYSVCVYFIWENHLRHNKVATVIVNIDDILGFFEPDLYCKGPLYPDQFKDFGKAKWGAVVRIILMGFATLVCIFAIF